ncbi:MAG: potassium channel family protein [Alphaproteobacteria bacterium]|nr:potassium channel family protein [Alphaproteobacteria bacterium]
MRQNIRDLYFGKTRKAKLFRYGLLGFDIFSILFFIISSLLSDAPWIHTADLIIALIIASDVSARLWISEQPGRLAFRFTTILDVIVVLSLVLPQFIQGYLFLRIMRALRLLRTYRVLQDLRGESAFFRRNEEVVLSAVNLGVFVFIMTALVYVLQRDINPQITNYIDALYFTVTALTTTGFGDIVLKDASGRLLSVLIMVIGVALFLRMVQTIFRPNRVHVVCSGCGLNRHDADAVHCKHCGKLMMIETEGLD